MKQNNQSTFPTTENWLRSMFDESEYKVFITTLQRIKKGKFFKELKIHFVKDETEKIIATPTTKLLYSLISSIGKGNATFELRTESPMDLSSLIITHKDRFFEQSRLLALPELPITNPKACEILDEMKAIHAFLSLDETELIQRL